MWQGVGSCDKAYGYLAGGGVGTCDRGLGHVAGCSTFHFLLVCHTCLQLHNNNSWIIQFNCYKKPENLIAQQVQFVIGHLGHFQLEFICQIWTQDTLRHILGPIMAIFEICPFLTTPGLFE